MTIIGFIGAGSIGSNVARAATQAGYDVILSNSHGPDSLAELVTEIGPRATAASMNDAARQGDFVVIAVPLTGFGDVPAEPIAGKVVLMTANYFPQHDGQVPELDDGETTVAEMLQKLLPQSRVVKVFSHLNAAEVPTDGTPAGTPNRRALAISGGDDDAKQVAIKLYDDLGYDALDLGGLDQSWKVGGGQPAFVVRQNLQELAANVALAQR